MTFPAALPHGPIEQIADHVFMVRGTVMINPVIRFSRNMVIVRDEDALTLIDPVRLDDAELARLEALGEVRHLLRLGAMHGMDDPFYVDRYGASFWSQPGGSTYTEPGIDRLIEEGDALPFGGAELFCFRGTLQPECALLLPGAGDLLLTCDAIQHYGDYGNANLIARLMSPLIGFPKTTVLGPFWIKGMTPEGGTLRGEFERLLEMRFERLLGAHGSLLESGAHAAVARAVDKVYGG